MASLLHTSISISMIKLKKGSLKLVSSLIAQLCSEVVDLPERLKGLHKRRNNGQERAAKHELKAVLSGIMKDFGEVFITADALNECPKNGEREELLRLIIEMKSWSQSRLHLLATSRQEPDIEEALTSLTNLTVPIKALKLNQILNYILYVSLQQIQS